MKFDMTFMVKVSQMYYIDGLKQEEIASQLSISRSQISMILTEAKDVGIVEVIIRNPLTNNDELSSLLTNTFHLKTCMIVPASSQDTETLRNLVVKRAIEVVNMELKDAHKIGIGWGRTCHQLALQYKAAHDTGGIQVVSLIGGSNQIAEYYQINEIVRIFADKLSGTPYFIHAPVLTSSAEEKVRYMKSESMQDIAKRWSDLDLVICGIGSLTNIQTNDRESYIGEFDLYKQLVRNSVVGDICASYFNVDGEFIKDDYFDKMISIPEKCLRAAKKVVCIVSGPEKARSILGALKANMIDIFISDEQTARSVLKLT